MTRLFLDDLRAEIEALLPDNTSGLISPADMRQVCQDTVDSCVADDSTMYRDPASGNADLITQITPTDIVAIANLSSTDANMDGTTADAAGGFYTSGSVAGRGYYLIVQANIELTVNAQFVLGVEVDSVLSDFKTVINGQGAGKPISASLLAVLDSVPANANVQLVAWTPDGVETVEFLGLVAQYIINPTNNP